MNIKDKIFFGKDENIFSFTYLGSDGTSCGEAFLIEIISSPSKDRSAILAKVINEINCNYLRAHNVMATDYCVTDDSNEIEKENLQAQQYIFKLNKEFNFKEEDYIFYWEDKTKTFSTITKNNYKIYNELALDMQLEIK